MTTTFDDFPPEGEESDHDKQSKQPRPNDFERVPPQDLAAEESVLGGMMLSKDAIADVVEILRPGDYYRPAHEIIHDAILDLYGRGEPADPITVADELLKRGDLVRVGGPSYVHTLVNNVPTAANAEYYAEIVHEKAVLRRLVEAGTRIAAMGYAAEGDVDEIADAAQAELAAAVEITDDPQALLIGEGFDDYVDELEALQKDGQAKGVPTGFADFDALTGGLQPGQIIIIAARPAIGKSTLALDFARSAAIKHQLPTVFFSLEMSRSELINRTMSAEGRIALHHMRQQDCMNASDWESFAKAMPRVSAAPLTIDASPELTVMQIKAKCRRLKQRGGLDLVVIDYLQLLSSGLRRVENRQVEVATMSRNLKLMAKELQVPVVVLCQLNRGPEQRTDKRPVPSDLRESGSLEQDADIVILLHREDAHEKESPRAGEADFIVAKHRNGPTAIITTAFQGHYSRFVDMAPS
jgi:replicative DNA helicase